MLSKLRLAYRLAKHLSEKELTDALAMPVDDEVIGDGQGGILPYMTEEEAYQHVKDSQGGWGKLRDKVKSIINLKE